MLVKELVSFNKLDNKKYSLQFLPYSLLEISKLPKIKFKEKNLKTSIIIDIIHNLILKYFFKKDNSFKLNATVLKEKYGHLYNYYIQFLIENKIIFLEKNYVKGKNSRIYSISQDIIKGNIYTFDRYSDSNNLYIEEMQSSTLIKYFEKVEESNLEDINFNLI